MKVSKSLKALSVKSLSLPSYLFSTILLSITLLYGCRGRNSESKSEQTTIPSAVDTLALLTDGMHEVRDKVKNGEVFSGLLSRLGMSAKDAYILTESCDSVFDVKKMRAGNAYTAYFSDKKDSTDSVIGKQIEYILYEKDNFTQIFFHCTEPFWVKEISKPVTTEMKFADVTIVSSLWNDMIAAGASPLLSLTLSDIYAWTVDFFGLQKGDRFRVFYDEKSCEGKVIAIDTVRYAVFTHAGKDYTAVMFNQNDGGNIYWNSKGESMRKAFLKAPLHYSRISSGFSYARKHPITRRVQPHTGVDYAAPAGTPVMSIGDGVVTSMKNEGAGGNTVRIKHNSVYSTAYLHLSKFASNLRRGARVSQGQVIGYVGSTGRSTGPHLDFRVWKNGSPINPLTMSSPPAEPLKAEFKPAFDSTATMFSHRIEDITSQRNVN